LENARAELLAISSSLEEAKQKRDLILSSAYEKARLIKEEAAQAGIRAKERVMAEAKAPAKPKPSPNTKVLKATVRRLEDKVERLELELFQLKGQKAILPKPNPPVIKDIEIRARSRLVEVGSPNFSEELEAFLPRPKIPMDLPPVITDVGPKTISIQVDPIRVEKVPENRPKGLLGNEPNWVAEEVIKTSDQMIDATRGKPTSTLTRNFYPEGLSSMVRDWIQVVEPADNLVDYFLLRNKSQVEPLSCSLTGARISNYTPFKVYRIKINSIWTYVLPLNEVPKYLV